MGLPKNNMNKKTIYFEDKTKDIISNIEDFIDENRVLTTLIISFIIASSSKYIYNLNCIDITFKIIFALIGCISMIIFGIIVFIGVVKILTALIDWILGE